MKIILISGKARSGKDTTAELFKEALSEKGSRVLITHYADLLKYICKTFFSWDGVKDIKGRQLLQHVGTDVIRQDDPNLWVDFVLKMLRYSKDLWDYVIVPDCRFPNEISVMTDSEFDVVTVRVSRDEREKTLTNEQQSHPSETALDKYDFDVKIYNDGTLDELKYTIDCIIKENYI